MRLLLLIAAAGLAVGLREAGRGLLAWALGLRVQRFTVGLGPPAWTLEDKDGRGAVIAAFPFGARVEVAGLEPLDEDAGDRDFRRAAAWRRWTFLLSGPALSVAAGWALLVLIYASGTHAPVPLTVGTVLPGSEAARAGLRTGDTVISLDGQPLEQWGTLVERVRTSPGRPLSLLLHREAEILRVTVEPRPDGAGEGRIGVTQLYEHHAFPLAEALQLASAHLWRVVEDGVLGILPDGKPGLPSRLVRQAADSISMGMDAFLRLLAGLCVALGLVHLVPLPPLDAGRALLFVLRPRVGARLEMALHAAGGAGLLALAAWAVTR